VFVPCSSQVQRPAPVGRRGRAGALGFTTPELNARAPRDLGPAVAGCGEGVSTSRICEIGLSERGGLPYRSVLYLVDRASR
jgi:D-lactate dehydrogenase